MVNKKKLLIAIGSGIAAAVAVIGMVLKSTSYQRKVASGQINEQTILNDIKKKIIGDCEEEIELFEFELNSYEGSPLQRETLQRYNEEDENFKSIRETIDFYKKLMQQIKSCRTLEDVKRTEIKDHPIYGRKLLAEIDKFQAIKRKLSQKKDCAMITLFNKMPWTIRDSKSIQMMRLRKDALKMRKIARRFADEEIESKMDKLKSLVSKAIEWLRNKGRIIVQANPIATNLFKGLLSLNSALQMLSGVYNVGASVSKASAFAKEARKCNLSISQFLSQVTPEERPLSILLKGIRLLLISIIKSLTVREISKMQSEKIQDAGVKGMKKGQHIKAKDPNYIESLKGGGGNNAPASSNSQQKQGLTTKQKVGIGMLAAGGALMAAGGLGMHRALKGISGSAAKAAKALPKPNAADMLKSNSTAANAVLHGLGKSKAATAAKALPISEGTSMRRNAIRGANIRNKLSASGAVEHDFGVNAQKAAMAKARQIASTASHSAGTHTGVINRMANSTKNMQRALANPRHVFDI